jgi:hypothetical protein
LSKLEIRGKFTSGRHSPRLLRQVRRPWGGHQDDQLAGGGRCARYRCMSWTERRRVGSACLPCALFAWLISHQPTVLFSQNKPATSNQLAVLFSHNKSAPATSNQPNEQAAWHLPASAKLDDLLEAHASTTTHRKRMIWQAKQRQQIPLVLFRLMDTELETLETESKKHHALQDWRRRA